MPPRPLTARRGGLAHRYTVRIAITGPLLVAGALTSGASRVVIWALAAEIDLAALTVLQLRLRDVHYNAAHLAERFSCSC